MKEPKNTIAKIGSDLKLECVASGVMSISWYKLEESEKKFIRSGTELRFSNVQLSDNGLYECSAENGVDKPLKKTFRVIVNGTSLNSRSTNNMIL